MIENLVCPEAKLGLTLLPIEEAELKVGAKLSARKETLNARGNMSKPFGRTTQVLLREDHGCAYPVVEGVPILLVPERLIPESDQQEDPDLTIGLYAEAYEEMEFYNEEAEKIAGDIKSSQAYFVYNAIVNADQEEKDSFPYPKEIWIDAVYDCFAQMDAYSHISPVRNNCVMQIGGKGEHLIKFLFAGADEAFLITPMMSEAVCAQALAEEFGFKDKLHAVVSIAEELPFRPESIDAIYSGGCLHHMQTEVALYEIARVLRTGGRFAAADPWKTPVYELGKRVFGQREAGACHPLTKSRLKELENAFEKAEVIHHGTMTRYFLLVLSKFGINIGLPVAWFIGSLDDYFCSFIPGMRNLGSSVSILATK